MRCPETFVFRPHLHETEAFQQHVTLQPISLGWIYKPDAQSGGAGLEIFESSELALHYASQHSQDPSIIHKTKGIGLKLWVFAFHS